VGYKVAFSEGYVFACPWIGMCIIACSIISGHQGIQVGRQACPELDEIDKNKTDETWLPEIGISGHIEMVKPC